MSTKARAAAKKAWIKKHKLLRKKMEEAKNRKLDRVLAGLPAFCTNIGEHGEVLEGERAFFTNGKGEIIREEYYPPEDSSDGEQGEDAARATGEAG